MWVLLLQEVEAACYQWDEAARGDPLDFVDSTINEIVAYLVKKIVFD